MRRSLALLILAVSPVIAQPAQPEIRRATPVSPVAQEPVSSETEIRRAEPIDPQQYQNPAWMDRVPTTTAATPTPEPPAAEAEPTPIPVQRALPVERFESTTPMGIPEPAATPLPVPSATPTPEAPPPPALPPSETGEDYSLEGDTIRFGPGTVEDGANRSLVAATGFYRRKMYDMAIFEYEKFLISEPSAAGRDGALFRLAESHRFLGNERAAREGYQRLLSEFKEGEFAGAAAFRLAEIAFATGNYGAAADLFRRAQKNSKEREIQLTAQFYLANSLNKLGRTAEALVAFRTIAENDPNNPYREDAEFFVAEALSKSSRLEEALAAFEKLGSNASKPAMQAEALVKAAALAAQLEQTDHARKLFESALAHPAIGSWRGVARLGLIRIAYINQDFATAANMSDAEINDLPKEARPEALLIVANSNRQMGQKASAIRGYDRILQEFPKSDSALQARFQRLVSLDIQDDTALLAEIDTFLKNSTNPRERAQASLMKAEALARLGKLAEAAPLYEGVLKSNLPKRLKEQAHFKLGWALANSDSHEAAQKALRGFLSAYPKSELAPSARVQLALSLQKSGDYPGAIETFDAYLNENPGGADRQVALQQKALTLGQLEDYPPMIATFQQLLKEFPDSPAAVQAHYWIGWANFEAKDYDDAIIALKKARELDKENYGDRATLRIILSHFYLEDRDAVAAETANLPAESVPPEVTAWLASGYFNDGNFAEAEKFLEPIAAATGQRAVDPDIFLQLARARIALEKFGAAEEPVSKFLATARDPAGRARGLLLSAEISLGQNKLDDADRLIEESLLLQPEGRLNAEARMMNGRALMKRNRPEDAARAFATVSILTNDPTLTPEALRLGSEAYRRAGKPAEAAKLESELRERFPNSNDT